MTEPHPSRRRFLTHALPALAAGLTALPALAVPLASGPSRALADPFDVLPFPLHRDPSALSWLADKIRTQVAPGDRARVFAAAQRDGPHYPFLWVAPHRDPDFDAVLAWLDSGEIPAHRRGLDRWECGILCRNA